MAAPLEPATYAGPSFADAELEPLPDGADVAVLWLLGSLCPITRAHVLSLIEGRALLIGRPLSYPLPLAAPGGAPAPRAAACLAIVAVNPDCYLEAKFARLHEARPVFFPEKDRAMLAAVALSECRSWASVLPPDGPRLHTVLSALAARHAARRLTFTVYEVSGADDCLRYRKWRHARADWRLYVPLRSPDSRDEGTRALVTAMLDEARQRRRPGPGSLDGDGADSEAAPPHAGLALCWPHVILGPGLPPLSSTEARAALRVGDAAALAALLPAAVIDSLRGGAHRAAGGTGCGGVA